jgi:hypothetical protein
MTPTLVNADYALLLLFCGKINVPGKKFDPEEIPEAV